MRAQLAERFPDHGVFGEEEGMGGGAGSQWLWVLDPIDGTKSFITGAPGSTLYGCYCLFILYLSACYYTVGVAMIAGPHRRHQELHYMYFWCPVVRKVL